jgi:signal transduction histidine kinase
MEIQTGDNERMHGDILVIEDSPTQAAQLQHILERNGFTVSMATNGKEALAVIAGKKPALVISDVVMPEMDGFELCRRIKADDRSRGIPVILLTSLSDPLDVIRGLECGADNFLTKPCAETYLLSRIQYMLDNRNLQESEHTELGVEVTLACEKHLIKSDRVQILNLLLSSYETAIQKNRELTRAKDELNKLNDRLATANRELEAFNYTVSHDLRVPLTGICGYSDILLEMYGDRLDADCKECVREILNSARHMNQLIGTLLNFSRLTQATLQRRPVDLSSMVRSIADELQAKDPHRRVMFTIENGVTADGDARLLEVVLQNLMDNAWKYTGKREEALIEFGATEVCGTLSFFVRDNGAGFDETRMEKLFLPFQRLHDPEEYEGCGIGLATVQRIIERHGGSVWAEGEVDKGAAFFFTLPVAHLARADRG